MNKIHNPVMVYWTDYARKESYRLKKLKAQKIIRNALRGAAMPLTIAQIRALHTNGALGIDTFYDNIGAIFPTILALYSDGLSVTKIERLLGFNDRCFEAILYRYPRLNVEMKKARRVRADDALLLKALLD